MRIVFDVEANALENPTKIWVIVCKDIDKGDYHIFRKVTDDVDEAERFRSFAKKVSLWVGHNCLGYDIPVIWDLCGIAIRPSKVIDTLVISKLFDYSREGHSIEWWGEQFGLEKIKFNDFSKYSLEMEKYCGRDVDVCERIFSKFAGKSDANRWDIFKPRWRRSIDCEQRFQGIIGDMHRNGFGFNSSACSRLHDKVTVELAALDKEILEVFPPKLTLVREITPEVTKHGTLHKKDFKWVRDGDLSEFNGGPFCKCAWTVFNPSSPKQTIAVLAGAGWSPTEKTKTHIETERAARRRDRDPSVNWKDKLDHFKQYGWKINETNLSSLPDKAPKPARTLAQRILLEARRRTLEEWSGLVSGDGRIHGQFYGLGAWTHRMAHQNPNTANIPNPTDLNGNIKLLGSEMRSLWIAPKGRLLVGVDADSIQLRIFAHLINDEELIHAIVSGRKTDKTDPHSVNQRVLGRVCKTRDAAKRFVYSFFFGAGAGKVAEILDCSPPEAEEALNRFIERYPGLRKLKATTIPRDAARGYFIGLDGRSVRIKGTTESQRKHLALSGYLQNGEVVCMKHATLIWYEQLKQREIDFLLVDMVHDEWQTECPNDMGIALAIAEAQCQALEEVGRRLKLRCPLKGSYGEFPKYTIGSNWKVTH